jgi:predicted permease
VLLFSLAAAAITGLLFGLAPAWRVTRVDPQSAMKAQGRGVAHGSGRFALGRALVVGQVALSLVLVVAAGLLMGSFRKLTTLDAGFRREGILLASMDLSRTGWPEAQRRTTHRVLLDRLRLLPGVRNAAASFTPPIGKSFGNAAISVGRSRAAADPDSSVMFNPVSDGWFATMGTRMLAGRDFTPGDGKPGAEAVIINESLARKFFGESAPLGRQIRIANVSAPALGPPMEVVAVVRDVKYGSIDEENQPTAYVPLAQGEWYGQGIEMALTTDGPLAAVVPSITRMAAEVSPSISLEFVTLSEQVNSSLRRPRVLATLSGFFAALALILAVVGLYGTVAYGVTRRRTEIGIRLALGAARGSVLRMVLGDAGRLVLLGIAAGVLTAIGTTRLLQAFLYGLTPNDTWTLVVSAAVLLGAAVVASAIPAWRAASLDPTETLREE